MSTSTTIRSWPSLSIGGFFAGITGWVLLADVVSGASPLTPAHMMSVGAIVAAIASGHAAWPQIRRGAVVPALLLCVLFAASTVYVVIASAARNAETSATKSAKIADNNAARARELRQLVLSEAMLKSANDRLDADCVRGRASKSACDGIRATIGTHTAAVKGSKATLKELGPELAANGGYAVAAKTLAALPGITASPAAIEERLVLILPFLTVLISELGCITFLHLGLGHRQPVPAAVVAPKAPSAPVPPKGKGRRGRKADPKVLDFMTEYRKRNGRAATAIELRAQFPEMPKTTAYRYAA